MSANNAVLLTGNLTKDPEVKSVNSSKVAKFSLAVSRFYKDTKETSFFDMEAWGSTAEFVEKHLKKGSSVSIQGEARQDTWEKDGEKRSRVIFRVDDVKFVGAKKKDEEGAGSGSGSGNSGDNEVPF